MAIEEGNWAVCVCISYTGDGGQLGCSFLWSGQGGWGGQILQCTLQVTLNKHGAKLNIFNTL